MKERTWEKERNRSRGMKMIVARTWRALTSSQTRNGGNGENEEKLNSWETFRNRFQSPENPLIKRRGMACEMRTWKS